MLHRRMMNAHIELEFDNALDDMHDDGIATKWIDAIAARRNSLIPLLVLRHDMNCSHLDDSVECDECTDDDFDMHFLTCHLNDYETACESQISDFVYSALIRPRWEDEPMMTEPGHIARSS